MPNIKKPYQTAIKYTIRAHMVIKYTIILLSKTLQKDPNKDFWYEKKPSGNPG
jgi:hypothetical protein